MSVLSDKISANAKTLFDAAWNERNGQVVPSTESVAHSNGAVKVKATYLYADLADSTEMQKLYGSDFAARVHRMYLGGASEIIRANGGTIKSFDGDRVMGIFMGDSMRNQATNAALKINWVVSDVVNKLTINRKRANGSWWRVEHGVGIDCGDALIVRAGVRNKPGGANHNDLISIGAAPAIAAKLSGLRKAGGPTIVTDEVYRYLNDATKLSVDKKPMFTGPLERDIAPYTVRTYASTWWRQP